MSFKSFSTAQSLAKTGTAEKAAGQPPAAGAPALPPAANGTDAAVAPKS